MITTSFTKDLYKTFINPAISYENLLKSSRFVTVAAGFIGIGMAVILPNVISALSIFYSLMSVSLTAPLLFGLFSKRASTKAAFIAALSGILVTLCLPTFYAGKGIGILNAQSTAILVSLLLMGGLCVFRPKPLSVKE